MPEPTIIRLDPATSGIAHCAQCNCRKTRRSTLLAGHPGRRYFICKPCKESDYPLECSVCNAASSPSGVPFTNADGTRTCVSCANAAGRFMCQGGCRTEVNIRNGMCPACAANRFECSACRQRYLNPSHQHRDRILCQHCYNNAANIVHNSSFKDFHDPMGEGPLWFGVELETEIVGADYRATTLLVNDLVGHFCILKSDGSLNDGIEIVSCPCTFDVHQTIWEPLFKQRPKALFSHCSGRAGIHIHVSRDALLKHQLGRMLVFINAPANTSLVETVAGRSRSDYCRRIAKKLSDYDRRSDKFEALNTGPDQTVEFRIFRGTLNYTSFLKNIEFAHAAVMACGKVDDRYFMTPEECEQPDKFLTYVAEHRQDYPNLHKFLVWKDFIHADGPIVAGVADQFVEI